jgi:hypothetical protein
MSSIVCEPTGLGRLQGLGRETRNCPPVRLILTSRSRSAHVVADDEVVVEGGVVLGGRVTVVVRGVRAVVAGVTVVDVDGL